MLINYSIRRGRRHISDNVECQDFAHSKFADNKSPVNILAVSDGCSSAKFALEAAKVNCYASEEFFSDLKNWNNISNPEKIVDSFLKFVARKLDDTGADYDQLAATIASAAIMNNGDYIVLSLGDCTVIAYDNDFSPRIFCKPFNIGDSFSTIFTNNYKNGMKYMILKTGNIFRENINGFALFTDGCESLTDELLKGAESMRDAAFDLAVGSNPDVLNNMTEYIADNLTTDDAAIGIILSDSAVDESKRVINDLNERMHNMDQNMNSTASADRPFSDQPPMYDYILRALAQSPKTAEELVNEGICHNGCVLSTMKPLVEMKLVHFAGGKFSLAQGFLS